MAAVALFFLAPPEDSLFTTEKLIAVGEFRKALDLLAAQPPSLRRHLLASKAHDGLGHNTPEAALDAFSEALTALPGSLMLRLGKGLALKDLARYPEAETELTACLARQPDLAIAFDALGTVYLPSKRFEELARTAGEFRKRSPDDYRGPYFAAAAAS